MRAGACLFQKERGDEKEREERVKKVERSILNQPREHIKEPKQRRKKEKMIDFPF